MYHVESAHDSYSAVGRGPLPTRGFDNPSKKVLDDPFLRNAHRPFGHGSFNIDQFSGYNAQQSSDLGLGQNIPVCLGFHDF